ncbi:MAG: GatB/YqeY domain-containing protein [Bacilli bacterium]|nr:GatB/YqeY domain-containing protein [Bacilli bacterium]
MLIEQLQKANIAAMKEHDNNKRAVLSVVISSYKALSIDLRASNKEITDNDLIRIIQKTIKELDDEKSCNLSAGRIERAEEIEIQKQTISQFLPKMLSNDEIKQIISSLEDKSIPAVMKYFKANYDGQVDMGLVNKIARNG